MVRLGRYSIWETAGREVAKGRAEIKFAPAELLLRGVRYQ
jgi:hypothetical protein